MADALASGKRPDGGGSKDDAFVRSTFRLAEWVNNNVRVVLVGAAGIAILVIGIVYYVNFQTSVREQAASELATLRLGATGPEMLISELETYVQRYAGVAAADEGRLLLARTYLDNGQPVEAERVAIEISAAPDEPSGSRPARSGRPRRRRPETRRPPSPRTRASERRPAFRSSAARPERRRPDSSPRSVAWRKRRRSTPRSPRRPPTRIRSRPACTASVSAR